MVQFVGHERDAFNVSDSSGSVVTADKVSIRRHGAA
jgi:hypothetical protein